MEYYIYIYLDLTDVPFYIGKGKDSRYYISNHLCKGVSNQFLKNKIRKVGKDNVKVQFIKENLTEQEAFCIERFWIKLIGRRDLGLGPLCNLTDGGEGDSGYLHSEETKQKISEMLKGKMVGEKNPSYGKPSWNKGKKLGPLSNECKCKISKALEGNPSPMKGKTHSEETKRKISRSMEGKFKGRKISEEQKRKIRETLKGHPAWNKNLKCSEETKQKMEVAQQRRRNEERKLEIINNIKRR